MPSNPNLPGAARAAFDSGALLRLLAEALNQAAGIYNQSAPSKVKVDLPRDANPARLSVTIQSFGYRFEESDGGSLFVSEIGNETPRAWARLEPLSDASGRIVCWRERKLQNGTAPTLRTSDGLSEEYLLNLLRKRLVRSE